MSVYFHHVEYADHHIEKSAHINRETRKNPEKNIQIVGGDFNAELGPGIGIERRATRMKQRLMFEKFVALDTKKQKKHLQHLHTEWNREVQKDCQIRGTLFMNLKGEFDKKTMWMKLSENPSAKKLNQKMPKSTAGMSPRNQQM